MIPRTIHHVWLSGEEMPLLNRTCIESWHRALAGYEIRCWQMSDFDIDAVTYVREAVNERKWAFATDYLRALILFREGGIYLDSDVYMFDSFDRYLEDGFFSCIEFHRESTNSAIQAACIGSHPGHPLLKDYMEHYSGIHFSADGCEDKMLAPGILAEAAGKYGFDSGSQKEQVLDCGIHIYDSSMIAGTPWDIKDENIGIHMCEGSWRDIGDAERRRLSRVKLTLLLRELDEKCKNYLLNLISYKQ